MTAIIGIKIKNRIQDAKDFQEILTKFGCEIRTRIGLHPSEDYKCSNYGIVILEVTGKVNEIYDELSKFWDIQIMKF